MNIQLKYKRNQFFTKSSSVHNVSVISKISWTSLQNPTSCLARLRELTLKLREPSSRLLSTRPLQSWPAESHKSITRFPGCTADYKLLFTLWDICNLTKNSSLSPNTDRYVKLKLWLTFMRSFGSKNRRQFQPWAKSSTEGTVNSINLNRGEKHRELDEIWQNDKLV